MSNLPDAILDMWEPSSALELHAEGRHSKHVLFLSLHYADQPRCWLGIGRGLPMKGINRGDSIRAEGPQLFGVDDADVRWAHNRLVE